MADFIPQVSRKDVERIVRRDFPEVLVDRVMELLDSYGREEWQSERERVQLACLKLAAGDLRSLQQQVEVANLDYRDVLAGAEFPGQCRIGFVGMSNLEKTDPKALEDLQLQDWEQYKAWLYRDNASL